MRLLHIVYNSMADETGDVCFIARWFSSGPCRCAGFLVCGPPPVLYRRSLSFKL